jgi:hypothetical protein
MSGRARALRWAIPLAVVPVLVLLLKQQIEPLLGEAA